MKRFELLQMYYGKKGCVFEMAKAIFNGDDYGFSVWLDNYKLLKKEENEDET